MLRACENSFDTALNEHREKKKKEEKGWAFCRIEGPPEEAGAAHLLGFGPDYFFLIWEALGCVFPVHQRHPSDRCKESEPG